MGRVESRPCSLTGKEMILKAMWRGTALFLICVICDEWGEKREKDLVKGILVPLDGAQEIVPPRQLEEEDQGVVSRDGPLWRETLHDHDLNEDTTTKEFFEKSRKKLLAKREAKKEKRGLIKKKQSGKSARRSPTSNKSEEKRIRKRWNGSKSRKN